MSTSGNPSGDYDFGHALPADAPAEIKADFVKYHVEKVFAKPRRPFTVWEIYSEKFEHFDKDAFNALSSELKIDLRDCLRDQGVNIRVGSGIRITDELMKAKEYGNTWPRGDHEEQNYPKIEPMRPGVMWATATPSPPPPPTGLERDAKPRVSPMPSPFHEFQSP